MTDYLANVTELLMQQRTPAGWWEGELSTSALSTATASMALLMAAKACKDPARRETFDKLAKGGLSWLGDHQNDDGGWGDTVKSLSNISTTMLVHAVMVKATAVRDQPTQIKDCIAKAANYIDRAGGVDAVIKRYGKDHTFSVPILTHCALAGTAEWSRVMPLPFELACVPAKFYAAVKMPVVSYALPALIAIGQVIFEKQPPRNPLLRWIRRRSIDRSLRVLESIQPSNGGFLEATPLTSFVCMSLLGCGRFDYVVTQRCLQFIEYSVRPDGSWPIDTNLATWVTTLSVNALTANTPSEQDHATLPPKGSEPKRRGEPGAPDFQLTAEDREPIRRWLLDQQYKVVHPFTNAAPGGWSWIDQPGGVPDADDTPGAMLAVMNLRGAEEEFSDEEVTALRNGANWLLDLQNRDGGWPTFCRGWGTLPFDRSSNDLTAHAIRALFKWQAVYAAKAIRNSSPASTNDVRNSKDAFRHMEPPSAAAYLQRIQTSIDRGFAFLNKHQRPDGTWLPLWFGNQHNVDDENPLYGTAKVLLAYVEYGSSATPNAWKAVEWLVANQNDDGGWSGSKGLTSSVEETGLAIEALAENSSLEAQKACENGVFWLQERIVDGTLSEPSPIGFYFAKLWYFERLYPLIFAVAGMRKYKNAVERRSSGRSLE